MFFTYLRRELRRRSKQAIVVAVGLAIGIGLVVTVSATSAGVSKAQGQVLHSLYGVGTAMTVSKTAKPGSFGPQHFGGFTGPGGSGTRPAAGTHISRNTLRPTFGTSPFSSATVGRIAKLHGTSASVGGLLLNDTSFSGTIPSQAAGASGGGFTPGGAGGGPNYTISSFSVDGIQITSSDVGPVAASAVTKGSYFTAKDAKADVAVVSSSYAKSDKLAVGSNLTVAGTSMKVIGIANTSSQSADVYLPLATVQKLASLTGKVTDVFVSASSASSVSSLASEVKAAVPGSTVATSSSLAKDVSGSLSSASSLANNLGKWLSIVALIVAIVVAGLLMMAAVSRRVREFGTLKAIGWRTRRVVGQVVGEGLALGVLGGVIGLVLGIIGAEVVSAISPALSASLTPAALTGGTFPGGGPGGGGFPGRSGGGGGAPGAFRGAGNAAHTVLVHLTAPLQGGTIGLAIGLAILGGLVAGALGAWRATRLRPAAALRRVE